MQRAMRSREEIEQELEDAAHSTDAYERRIGMTLTLCAEILLDIRELLQTLIK